MTRFLLNKIIRNEFPKFVYNVAVSLLREYKNGVSFLSNGNFSSPNFFKVNHREQEFQLSDFPIYQYVKVCLKARLIYILIRIYTFATH